MFWILIGVILGITIAQEYPDLPKIKPTVQGWYNKINSKD